MIIQFVIVKENLEDFYTHHYCGTASEITLGQLYRVGQKTDHFLKCITPVYDDVGRRSIYLNVQLFFRSKTVILNIAIFKYSLHNFVKKLLEKIH